MGVIFYGCQRSDVGVIFYGCQRSSDVGVIFYGCQRSRGSDFLWMSTQCVNVVAWE